MEGILISCIGTTVVYTMHYQAQVATVESWSLTKESLVAIVTFIAVKYQETASQEQNVLG